MMCGRRVGGVYAPLKLKPRPHQQQCPATLSNATSLTILSTMSNVASTLLPKTATMSKQHSTLSKGRNFTILVRRCCRLWQQSRMLLRQSRTLLFIELYLDLRATFEWQCCWCRRGLNDHCKSPEKWSLCQKLFARQSCHLIRTATAPRGLTRRRSACEWAVIRPPSRRIPQQQQQLTMIVMMMMMMWTQENSGNVNVPRRRGVRSEEIKVLRIWYYLYHTHVF